MSKREGLVLNGINNIYTVQIPGAVSGSHSGERLLCRIKGKTLKAETGTYNPIAAGDRVLCEEDGGNPGHGLILSRIERRNAFVRWNNKKRGVQVIAANLDLLVLVFSPENPPFRPRFMDRVLVAAEGEFPVLLVMNKADLLGDLEPERRRRLDERLEDYAGMGYETVACSARDGSGLDTLKSRIQGVTSAFAGQSGVGKSSLLNRIDPGFALREGEVSRKYNRGRHTTNYAVMLPWTGGRLIDTPGVRELEPAGIRKEELGHYLRDFVPYLGSCRLPACLHRHEPGCAVRQAVEKGQIHGDRYESYLRIFTNLEWQEKERGY